MANKHILIIGAGSAGKRHAGNLKSLGCAIAGVDPREDRLLEVAKAVKVENTFTNVESALAGGSKFDGAVVASPPCFHAQQAMLLLRRNIPVLLEKPVCPDLKSALELQKAVAEADVPLLLGYTWRWWPPLEKVKELLEKGEIGKLLHARMSMAAHLADWHPWERYQDFFMASKELGGGALLDESHWIDLMLWLLGMPKKLFAKVEKLSDLEIETDDNVDLTAYYDDGTRVVMHLDLYSRPHEKRIRFSGAAGAIEWTADPNRVAIGKNWENKWENIDFKCERNDMFRSVTEEFLRVIEGEPVSTCAIRDGVNVLRVIEAARESNATGKIVNV